MSICRKPRKIIKYLVIFITILIGMRLVYMFSHIFNNIYETKINGPSLQCRPSIPCEYPNEDHVGIRILILTHKRHESLRKLLNSINELEMDGDLAAIEIWIDRSKNNSVSEEIVSLAEAFQFKHGRVRVHVQPQHVGIMGQWIDTWRPKLSTDIPESSASLSLPDEIVLFLEDDISISPYAYRWLRAAHRFYANRTDMAGITLQSENFIVSKNNVAWIPPTKSLAFLYVVSSWGFSPLGSVWRKFQDWFKQVIKDRKFHPYVDGTIMTSWYQTFEKQHREDSMWTMWFIYYCYHHKLYTLYNNLNQFRNDNASCLSVNRLEPGLHYSKKGIDNTHLLLRSWKDEYVRFNTTIPLYKFNGKEMK